MRNIIMILLAAGLGFVAFFLAFKIWNNQPQAPQAPTNVQSTPQQANSQPSIDLVLVVVAKRDLFEGDQIDPANDFEWKKWPSESLSQDYIAVRSEEEIYSLDGYLDWYILSDIKASNPIAIDAISHIKPNEQTAEEVEDVKENEVPENALFITGQNLASLIAQGYTRVNIVIPETSKLIGSSRSGRGTWQKLSIVASNLEINSQPLYEGSDEKRYYILYPEELQERILLAEEYGLIKLLPTNGRSFTDISSFCLGTRCYEEIPPSEDLNLDGINLEESLSNDDALEIFNEDSNSTPPVPSISGTDLGGGL